MPDLTHILAAIDAGDPQAAAQLLPLLYDELRRLAAAQMAREKPKQTLDATVLVHESWQRLVGQDSKPVRGATGLQSCPTFAKRRHFFAATDDVGHAVAQGKVDYEHEHDYSQNRSGSSS